MRNLIFGAAVLLSTFTGSSWACEAGDTSKTLLVIAESSGGEENKVVASIDRATSAIQLLRSGFETIKLTGSQVVLLGGDGHAYVFDLSSARPLKSFCYPVVLAK